MKRVVFSFDDSRCDFYTRAYPILLSYKYPSTINVITGFISGDRSISFPTSKHAISREELLKCYHSGMVEIACHGSDHQNTRSDIEKNIVELKEMGVNTDDIGFASPNSVVTWDNKNENGIWSLVEEGTLKYVRSGVQTRREGCLYTIKSIVSRFTHWPRLFFSLNKHNIILSNRKNKQFLPSVSVYSYTTIKEIVGLVDKMPEDASIILMFHSILSKSDEEYGRDKYYWDLKKFESLCECLRQLNILVCTTRDIVE